MNGKNAFYIPPLAGTAFESPLDDATVTTVQLTQADWDAILCMRAVPAIRRGLAGRLDVLTSDPSNYCGTRSCTSNGNHPRTSCERGWTRMPRPTRTCERMPPRQPGCRGSQFGPQDICRDHLHAPQRPGQDSAGTLNAVPNPTTLTGTPTDWVYSNDGDTTSTGRRSSRRTAFRIRHLTVRYTLFKTQQRHARHDGRRQAVTVLVRLQEFAGGAWVTRGSDRRTRPARPSLPVPCADRRR